MNFKKFWKTSPPPGNTPKEKAKGHSHREIERPGMIGNLEEIAAFFQIGSMIIAHKDPATILELVTRESLSCLNAHRSTLFLLEGKSGILKTHFTYASDPLHGQIGLFEEKELARRALKQRRPFLLGDPEDFSEFFKYREREKKISSLVNFPLSSQDQAIGVLSLILINDPRSFSEKNLQILSIFGNYTSVALETAWMQEEVRRGIKFRKNYEHYLDDILNQLENFTDDERRRIEEHIGQLLPLVPSEADQDGGATQEPKITLDHFNAVENGKLPQRDWTDDLERVEFENESLEISDDLKTGGLFIRTSNPMELGEQFILRLPMPEGGDFLEVPCKVIWTNKYGKESKHLRRGMGVKFLELRPEAQRRVGEYMRWLRKKSPASSFTSFAQEKG